MGLAGFQGHCGDRAAADVQARVTPCSYSESVHVQLLMGTAQAEAANGPSKGRHSWRTPVEIPLFG